MKNLIYLFIIVLLFSMPGQTNAQTYGLKAGGHLSMMQFGTEEYAVPYNTIKSTYSMSQGYHFGATVEFDILKHLSIETGLSFSMRGLKFSQEDLVFGSSLLSSGGKTDLYYLEMPLNLIIPFRVDGLNFFGSVGPYAGYGLVGKKLSTYTFEELTEKTNESIKWGAEAGISDFRRFDYGISVGTGIDIHPLQVGISYSLGLHNISPKSDYGSKTNHQLIGVFIAYKFVKARKSAEDITVSDNLKTKPEKTISGRTGRKETIREEERLRLEKMRTDSIARVQAAEEAARMEKLRNDSIAAEKTRKEQLEAERTRLAKIKSDSIANAAKSVAVKPAEANVVYRVQFASSTKAAGTRKVTIGGKEYETWEYMFSGAYRSTLGEFRTFAEATRFQTAVRQSGYPQAFVVAFKNNIRVTDPALFK